ncbi:MAG: hypothetical protein ACI9L9_000723 [Marivirga sp.]|jgi:hypothetical protein
MVLALKYVMLKPLRFHQCQLSGSQLEEIRYFANLIAIVLRPVNLESDNEVFVTEAGCLMIKYE